MGFESHRCIGFVQAVTDSQAAGPGAALAAKNCRGQSSSDWFGQGGWDSKSDGRVNWPTHWRARRGAARLGLRSRSSQVWSSAAERRDGSSVTGSRLVGSSERLQHTRVPRKPTQSLAQPEAVDHKTWYKTFFPSRDTIRPCALLLLEICAQFIRWVESLPTGRFIDWFA